VRLDIDSMMCWDAIRPGSHLVGEIRLHQFYGDDIDVKFESLAGDPEPPPCFPSLRARRANKARPATIAVSLASLRIPSMHL
jgi:hypothetical protein